MSKISLTPNVSGTGTFVVTSPNSNISRTLTLPDSDGEILNAASTLDATKLSGVLPALDASALTGIAPTFNPVAVTGTTPSLNVGSYNFFDNGTLTGNTTVSFASVPTNARWSYSANVGSPNGYALASASYDSKSWTNVTEATPRAVAFSTDGTKMYAQGASAAYQYTLSTAWDVSTATYASKTLATSGQDTQAFGIAFSSDGTKMYMCGNTTDSVYQYTLSTAWDLATASYASKTFSAQAQETTVLGLALSADGTKVYILGINADAVFQYTLSTAWDISTATYSSKSFSYVAQETAAYGVEFNTSGTAMFIMGTTNDTVYQYTLSTAWDVSTATYSGYSLSFTYDTTPTDLAFGDGGRKLYIVGSATVSVYQYSTAAGAAITLPAAVVGTPSATAAGDRVTYDFFTLDAGVTVNLIGEEIV